MVRVGYVLIEQLAVALEQRRRPDAAGRPVIIGGYPYERKMVYEASAEAMAAGVKPGMPLRQAEQVCPSAVFLPPAEARYAEAAESLLAVIECFSPAVAPDIPGGAYFDAQGLAPLFGPDESLARRLTTSAERRLGITPRVAIASTRFTARVAARLSMPGTPHVVMGHPAEFLAEIPIEHLPGGASFYNQLRLLGIGTIGQFMGLPFVELMEQFGPVAVDAYNLAYGRGDPPLLPRPQPAALGERQELEPPTSSAAVLGQQIDRLSSTLAGALRRRYQACQTVVLRLELAGGALAEESAQLKEPAAQAAAIAAAARRLSERIRRDIGEPDGGSPKDSSASEVAAAQLIATDLVGWGGHQLTLFDAQRRRRVYLERAAVEVRRRFGDRLKRARRVTSRGLAAPPFVLQDYFD